MPSFSKRSKDNLSEVHSDLRAVSQFVIQYLDFAVLTGSRSKEDQNEKVEQGLSQVKWPNSKHNVGKEAGREYSHAVDIAPYPIDWKDRRRFVHLAGAFKLAWRFLHAHGQVAHALRWGGNWDMDEHLDDNTFDDLGHFEIQ